ncbi:hypothetical protein AVEN_119256-1 [Araneus ventricosus]|uniref:Uncharacterized protein n=1 Tax=Araneus ventricosus TaxID=182803 RepID=A0A4Y2PY54_ARAVE|nr:hypothetical protein AVEN_51679-1 [Araneus ventricosus]GBN55510.1 hypothetical protein AVEN_119256-1 [Araneus ventricosus]
MPADRKKKRGVCEVVVWRGATINDLSRILQHVLLPWYVPGKSVCVAHSPHLAIHPFQEDGEREGDEGDEEELEEEEWREKSRR